VNLDRDALLKGLNAQFGPDANAARAVDLFPEIPSIFKTFPNWVTFKSVEEKAPIISGKFTAAKSSDPSTWVPYELLCQNIQAGLGHKNIGWVPDGERSQHLTAIDIDNCRNLQTGEISEWAKSIIKLLGATYIEVTVSGAGLRAWVIIPRDLHEAYEFGPSFKANPTKKAAQVEVVNDKQYMTFSRQVLPSSVKIVRLLSEGDVNSFFQLLVELQKSCPAIKESKCGVTASSGHSVDSDFQIGDDVLEGGRNNTLSNFAFRRWVDEQCTEQELFDDVHDANRKFSNPLPDAEVDAIIRGKLQLKPGGKLKMTQPVIASTEVKVNSFEMTPEKKAQADEDAKKQMEDKAAKETREREAVGKMVQSIYESEVNDQTAVEVRQFHYDGLTHRGDRVLVLGATKAMKSYRALNKAMHDACGRSWLGFENQLGPMKSMYLDLENTAGIIKLRRDYMLQWFTPSERELIKANLKVISGQEVLRNIAKNIGSNHSYEYTDNLFWTALSQIADNCETVYIDCFYKLHNLPANMGEEQRAALLKVWSYFRPEQSVFMLHHLGRMSREAINSGNHPWLRKVGTKVWAQQISQSIHLLREATTIFCQELFEIRDKEGNVTFESVDFMASGRNLVNDTPLIERIPYYDAEDECWEEVFGEMPYRFKPGPLSDAAGSVLRFLAKTPDVVYPSVYALVRAQHDSVGKRQYTPIRELILKGHLVKSWDGYHLATDQKVIQETTEQLAETPAARRKVSEFLDSILMPNGVGNEGMAKSAIKALADSQNLFVADTPLAYGVRPFVKDAEEWWAKGTRADVLVAQEVERMMTANPTCTRTQLMSALHLGERSLNNALKKLGAVKKYGPKGEWVIASSVLNSNSSSSAVQPYKAA
jgi:hypothetical protein